MSEAPFYLLRQDGSAYEVVKLLDGPDGLVRAGQHRIDMGLCDCPGFKFRGDCRHKKMITEPPQGQAVPLSEARQAVRKLLSSFRAVFQSAELAEDPYDKNAEGLVTRVRLQVGPPTQPSALLPASSGAWEGVLKDSGLLVRFVIS